MESDQYEKSSVIKKVEQMNFKLEEHTKLLIIVVESIKNLSKPNFYSRSTAVNRED